MTNSSHFELLIIKYVEKLNLMNLPGGHYFPKWHSGGHSLQKSGVQFCIQTTLTHIQQD